jgi:hypothetical protein
VPAVEENPEGQQSRILIGPEVSDSILLAVKPRRGVHKLTDHVREPHPMSQRCHRTRIRDRMSHKGLYVTQEILCRTKDRIICHTRDRMSYKGSYVTQGILSRTRDRIICHTRDLMSRKGSYVTQGILCRTRDRMSSGRSSILVDVILRFFKPSYPLNYEILSVEGFHVSFEGLSCFGEAS